MTYEVVPYSPALDAQIAELQTHLWSPDPEQNADYFKWKHLENPFLDDPLVQLVMCAGRAVAMRSAFGAVWEVGNERGRHLFPCTDDLVVAPECRNSGVARQVMQATVDEATRRGFVFAVNLGAGPVTFLNSLATGWRHVGSFGAVKTPSKTRNRLQQIAAIVRRTPIVGRFSGVMRSGLLAALRLSGTFEHIDRRTTNLPGAISLASQPRPQAMASLVSRIPWDGRIRHVRDEAYFAWRFRDPQHEYRFLFWDEGRELQGYLVIQRPTPERADATLLSIADWEAANENIRTALLNAALGVGRLTQLRAWTATSSESTRALLQSHGFAPAIAPGLAARSEGLLVCRLGSSQPGDPWLLNGRDLRNMESWDLRMLYSMPD